MQGKYQNKYISFLGDSITTLKGSNPKNFSVFYTGKNLDVKDISDTWWGKISENLNAQILTNDSYSGSLVCAPIYMQGVFPSASSDERIDFLCKDNQNPDIVIIYMGINDYIEGALIDGVKRDRERYNYRYFSFAYDKMLKKIRKKYPDCEVWCATLLETFVKDNKNFVFPSEYRGQKFKDFNECIKECAKNNDCKVLDIYSQKIKYETLDTVHPTRAGMQTIYECMKREIDKL